MLDYNLSGLQWQSHATSSSTSAAIPAQSEKSIGHFAGHLKKYRTFDRTSEAYFATLARHYCISAVF